MNDVLFDLAVTSGILALGAWVCMQTSRPYFESKASRIISQTFAGALLLFSFGLSKATQNANGASTEDLVGVVLLFLVIKVVAMYLIGCYAKSVGKSSYWPFIGLLNSGLALVFMATSLWRDPKPRHQLPTEE